LSRSTAPRTPSAIATVFDFACRETESTSFYFWTISSNRNPERPEIAEKIHHATAMTFDEDRVVIEAQYANFSRFERANFMGVHVDGPLNRARRIITRLTATA
jgi:vanillate O-demethylase monooxygenase subunit